MLKSRVFPHKSSSAKLDLGWVSWRKPNAKWYSPSRKTPERSIRSRWHKPNFIPNYSSNSSYQFVYSCSVSSVGESWLQAGNIHLSQHMNSNPFHFMNIPSYFPRIHPYSTIQQNGVHSKLRKELIFGAVSDLRVTRWWPQARIFRGGSQVILVDRQHSTTFSSCDHSTCDWLWN